MKPGDLVQRRPFIAYAYRWSNCDYGYRSVCLADGVLRTALCSPLLIDDGRFGTYSVEWPIAAVATIVYVVPRGIAALVLLPSIGLVWVPTCSLSPTDGAIG